MPVAVTCARCGKRFTVKPSEVAKRNGNYCSRDCWQGTPEERFDAKVVIDPETGCHIWTGAKTGKGYGVFCLGQEKVAAHRWNYERHVGPIPDGLLVRHVVCDNPPCVNPQHLAPGTDLDNMRDRDLHGRNGWSERTHCSAGHEYTEENTRIKQRATCRQRICRTCEARWSRESYERKKEKRMNDSTRGVA